MTTRPRIATQISPVPDDTPENPRRPQALVLLALGAIVLLILAIAGFRFRGGESCAGRINDTCFVPEELAWYRENAVHLGDVVGRGRVDDRDFLYFTFAAVTRSTRQSVRGTRDEWELLDLGRRDALQKRVPIRTAAVPHPVVQAFLDDQERAGVPWRYWIGVAPVSDVFCLAAALGTGTAECVQWYPYQAIRWASRGGVADPQSVRLSPLGADAPRN